MHIWAHFEINVKSNTSSITIWNRTMNGSLHEYKQIPSFCHMEVIWDRLCDPKSSFILYCELEYDSVSCDTKFCLARNLSTQLRCEGYKSNVKLLTGGYWIFSSLNESDSLVVDASVSQPQLKATITFAANWNFIHSDFISQSRQPADYATFHLSWDKYFWLVSFIFFWEHDR